MLGRARVDHFVVGGHGLGGDRGGRGDRAEQGGEPLKALLGGGRQVVGALEREVGQQGARLERERCERKEGRQLPLHDIAIPNIV